MFRWDDCLEVHILGGLILTFISFILLLLTTFSTPYIKPITFLSTPVYHYGALGYCPTTGNGVCLKGVGYDTGSEVVGWLTRTMVLFGVGTFLILLAHLFLLLSLLRIKTFRNPVYFRTSALLAAFTSILAEIFALVLWVTARHRFDDASQVTGERARYGAAVWLGLVGAGCAFLR